MRQRGWLNGPMIDGVQETAAANLTAKTLEVR